MNKGVILVGLFSSYVAHIGCSYLARLLTFLLKTDFGTFEEKKKKQPLKAKWKACQNPTHGGS